MGRKKKEEAKVEEVKEVVEVNEVNEIENAFYDEQETKVTLDGLALLSRQTKSSAATVTHEQFRFIIDNYYATQQHRINIAGQIRAVDQGFDKVAEGEQPAIAWLFKDVQNRENQIKKMIDTYVKEHPVGQWLTANKGIGPLFAANLLRYIDITKCNHANQVHAYFGLNNNNTPWLGKAKAEKIVNEAYDHFGLKPSEITDDVFLRVAIASGRSITSVKRGFNSHVQNIKGPKPSNKTSLINYLAKPPFNRDAKKLVYLIGESFVLNSNRGSLYGELYKERKAYETMKNERGDYAEQAKKELESKSYNKETVTYERLSQGKLSDDHINMRARRWAVKIFLTHVFEALWIYTYKTNPPTIYPIAHQGHVDYIKPEVPYENYFYWDKSK